MINCLIPMSHVQESTVEPPFAETSTLRTVLLSPEFFQVLSNNNSLCQADTSIFRLADSVFVKYLSFTDTISKHVGLITLNNATPRADAMTKILETGPPSLTILIIALPPLCLIN
jgi:hypothetical protein